mmetsp:Transcript_3936/g.5709  ORF Transcript_3936/g.5709 Transcript_3936/m.5709 type:complete len:155 (-) Transcript_3936:1162-1626(-)
MAASTMMMRAFARSMARQKTVPFKLSAVRSMGTYYTEKHEYVKVDGGLATVGITDFAQSALGDIVFVDLPEVDDEVEKGESFGSVESVKAASDVYAPMSGKVVEVNEAIVDDPGLVNTEAEGDAWFIKVEIADEGDVSDLLEADAYKTHCENEE